MADLVSTVATVEATAGTVLGGDGGAAVGRVDSGQASVSGKTGAATNQAVSGTQAEDSVIGNGSVGQGADAATVQGSDSQAVDGKAQASTPIEYGDFSVPEGMTLNPELLGEFKEIAKGLGLKQDQAQALADLGVKQAQAIVSQFEAQRVAESAAWLQAAKTDKEFGGEKLAENLAVAKRAMDAFATPELKAVLDKTGLGNHPELIRAFVKAGKLISEDSLLPGGTQPVVKGGKSLAERLYPEQGKG